MKQKDAMYAILAFFVHLVYITAVCIASLIYPSTSTWLPDLVIRTATGCRSGLHDIGVSSSDGPICTGGRFLPSTLTNMDITLFMELIGDTK